MKKYIKVIIAVIAAIIIVSLLFESFILVSVVENGIKHLMKVRTHMDKVALRPFDGSVAIKGFKIFNPQRYKEKVMADVSLVLMDFKLKTFLEPGAYFDKIEMHVDKLNIIRDKDGVINLTEMEAFKSPQEKSEKPFLADKYIVEIENVYYIDRTKEENEQIKEININKRWEYDQVEDPDNLINVVAYKVFVGGNIIGVGLELQKLQKKLAKLAEHNKKLAESIERIKQEQSEKLKEETAQVVEKAKEAVMEQIDKTKESIKETVEDVQEMVDKTKDAAIDQIDKAGDSIKIAAEEVKETYDKTKIIIEEKIAEAKENAEEKNTKKGEN